MSTQTNFVDYCTLTIAGNTYLLSALDINCAVGGIPYALCSILVGSPIGNASQSFSDPVALYNTRTGAEASVTVSINQSPKTIFKGIFAGLSSSATPGGVTSTGTYTISVNIIHKLAMLNSYNLGTRVFVHRELLENLFLVLISILI